LLLQPTRSTRLQLRFLMSYCLHNLLGSLFADDFRQEPGAPFRLIDPDLD
jgi:hypothetical protein